MKIGQFLKKMVGGSMILAALACPVFNSCADFGADIEGIKGELADLEDRVVALEQKLNNDLAALQTLLEGKINALAGDLSDLQGKVDGLVTVKECKQNANGEYELTLSDGTKFTVYPKYEQDYSGIVTTITLDGVVYWAMFDANGKPQPMTDANGELIPVVDAVPQTKKGDDGFFYVSFDGGQTWAPTGVSNPCVFAGVEVVYTDNWTDEEEAQGWGEETPVYVVLTLADGSTISVTVDGAASFIFGNPYLGAAAKTQYIPYGTATNVTVSGSNIESWIKEVPAGWKIEESVAEFAEYGMGEFIITAPTAEAVASGAAVAEGNLKVLAIAQGGKSVTATLLLTTNAFSGISASKGQLTVGMNNGLGGYLVGVSKVADYDPEAIKAELKAVVEYYEEYESWTGEVVKEYTWSPWYPDETTAYDDNYMDGSVEDYPMDQLVLQEPLVSGEMYIVWAVALNLDMEYYNYTVGDIVSTQYLNASVTLDEETTVISFNSIEVSLAFDGLTTFFGGFEQQYPGYATTPADIVSSINEGISYGWAPDMYYVNDEGVEGWKDGVYTGDPNGLVYGFQEIEPAKDYYLYIVPVVEGKTVYSVSDVYWYEFTTEGLMDGGIVNVTAGEPVLDYKKISVPLSAEGAVYMYYSFVDPEMIPTIEDKQAYLIENGTMAKGASITAAKANISPSTTLTLIAMAVDKYGCYGDVFQQDYTSKTYEYASVTVAAELQGKPSTSALVKVSASAEVETYYYWYGEINSYQWDQLGGSLEEASAFIALTPNSYLLEKVAAADLPAEGIELTGLTLGNKYAFVVSAMLADGTFTKATLVEFEPSMDMGNFVYATDDNGVANPVWEAAKPTVTYDLDSTGEFTNISWTVSVPAGFTAKTTCFHQDFLTDYPTAKDKVQFIVTYPYIDLYDVVEGESYFEFYGSPGYNIYTVVCDSEGNYYETYVTELNITGGFGV